MTHTTAGNGGFVSLFDGSTLKATGRSSTASSTRRGDPLEFLDHWRNIAIRN